ncbi:hypothetical protein [Paenibacillus oryzisoli]|uniref:Uncharacterized protein n=1 Tax=Paenibacillus oryzisoli TaxID=1850517 RepID=A0A197ZVT2_9BACL|nr:hypothetical protein [Paenibacillus oryzisoli]OAS13319.1 hypothetical protein A8708_15775 [Paenibacillus oryzisoli]
MEFIEKYKRYRQTQVGFHTEVLDRHVDLVKYKEAANILGILNNGRVGLSSEMEMDSVYDFNVYAKIRNGRSALSEFSDSYSPKITDEEELLSAMLESHISLYEVVEINKEEGTLLITDILSEVSNPIKLVDLSLSKSLKKNALLFTRLVKLGEFSMTSGLGFILLADHKDYIIKKTQKMLKKMQTGDAMTDLFIVFFHLNRSDGRPVHFDSVK